ncbi:MAG: Carboxylesterase (Est-1) [Candidatus Giovannonibacteria bacterium GW2011_GWB1_45_9b]|uniref:Carboxylesterase (Est-1) n=1 Tax=Candidatus Giovannonibacteria bacterium GW2011_GWB1_45_9b TaxID=1618653 RepID=A0A0G1QEE4_9BACT|nr:MAG: Carboxylesterase (Est-1) [Candidatus Giovannonibacteria bacterium GW2011_GWB1_45_9b]
MIEKKTIESSAGKICYFKTAHVSGRPTVIFLHGLSANHTTWLNIMERLAAGGYNAVAPDIRGHGESDRTKEKSRYRLERFSNDLELIAKNEKLEKFILVGYSFGGGIAVDYSIKHLSHVAGLIIVSANYVNPLSYKNLGFLTPIAHRILLMLAALLRWQKREHYYKYDHASPAGYWHSTWIGLNTMPISVNFWMLAETAKFDFGKTIGNIIAPTLIVRAKSDPILSMAEAEDMARAMQSAKVVVSKHPSHFIASQSQEELAGIIINFLETL